MTTWSGYARRLRRVGVLAVAVVSLLAAACDKVPLLAPTESTIALTAAATTLPSSGSTTLSAVVVEAAGTAVQNGTAVRFVTTLGRVDPVEAQTRNGVATATFFADGASGIAEVRAMSGAATTDPVAINVGSAAVDSVSVLATPSSVPASGGTVTITASVTGEGNATLRGVPVSFSTTAGTLSATSAVTDALGNATVRLTTNRQATVTASVGSKVSTPPAIVSVATPATVTLEVETDVADRVAGQPILLTVTPATEGGGGTDPGRPVSSTVVLSWGDGSTQNLGLVAATRTVTHVYDRPGTYSISAEATDNGETTSTSVVVVIRPPAGPMVSVSPQSGTTSTPFVFTITPAQTGGVVEIDFDDGTPPINLGAVTTETKVTHQFPRTGTFVVRVVQTDARGGTTTGVTVVTVTGP